MQQVIKLKGCPLFEVKPIQRRANCKIVQIEGKSYLIGGMTADAISNQIFQFRFNHEYEPARIQWNQIHFDNDLFSPRNSFAACTARGMIYIWGGLEMDGASQKILSDLIQLDIAKGKMRSIPLKNPIYIQSASLNFDQETSQLIGYGGSDENANLPAFLYRLKLGEDVKEFQWIKQTVSCPQHQGFCWQHTASLSKKSFINGVQGSFLTIVGGCRLPHAPYNCIVEINLKTKKVHSSLALQTGLVSHDTVQKGGKLYIFGGSKGGDFNSTIYVLSKGTISRLHGHRAIGCSCCVLQDNKIIVYGGVCGQATINGAFIYEQQ